jgi:Tol biopolymer transport system component/serine/threonine protein kinase
MTVAVHLRAFLYCTHHLSFDTLPLWGPPEMTMEPGSRLASYTIVEKLADSDVGEVYVATGHPEEQGADPEGAKAGASKAEREVVLKVLQPALAEDVRRITKFKIKAAAVSKLDHPNVVPIIKMEKAGDVQLIATPRIDGRPLDQVTGDTGLLLDRIFKLAVPLTDAIASAHDADVIHGGLKPGNVMLANDGRLLVIDFAMNILHPDLRPDLSTMGSVVASGDPIDDYVDPLSGQLANQVAESGVDAAAAPAGGFANGSVNGSVGGAIDGPVSAPSSAVGEEDLEGTALGRKNPLAGIDDLPPPRKKTESPGSDWTAWGEDAGAASGAGSGGGPGSTGSPGTAGPPAASGALVDDAVARAGIGQPEAGRAPAGHGAPIEDADADDVAPDLTPAEAKLLETVSHLSPEQIKGGAPDARSDIFSLGVLLYGMATGHAAFQGNTLEDVAMAVLEEAPAPISDINPGLPRHLGRIIGRCVEKDPERRYQSARDLHNELEGLQAEMATGQVQLMGAATDAEARPNGRAAAGPNAAPQAKATGKGKGRKASGQPATARPDAIPAGFVMPSTGWGFITDWRFWSIAAAVLVVALIGGYLMGSLGGGSAAREGGMSLVRLTLDPGGLRLDPSITPGGNEVLYASPIDGDWDLYLQSVGASGATNLTADSTDDDTQPALSPDGQRVAFRSERDGGGVFILDRGGPSGESVQRIAERGFNPAWSPMGDEIVVAAEGVLESPFRRERLSELRIIDLGSGESRQLTGGDAVQPAWSPNGGRIAYWGIDVSIGQSDIWTIPAGGGEAVQVTNDEATDWSPAWSPDGQYLYFASNRSGSMDIWRARVDQDSGRVRGDAEPVTSAGTVWSSHPSFARDAPGRMVYVESRRQTKVRGVPLNASRGTTGGDVTTVLASARNALMPEPSPDGRWVAFATGEGQQEDIYVVRTDGSELRQLTNDVARDHLPRWSPDGRIITFVSNRTGSEQIWSIRPDGSDLRQVTAAGGRQVSLAIWSPNGSQLCLNTSGDLIAGLNFLIDPTVAPDQQTLGGIPPMMGGEAFEAFSWSPDSGRLAGTLRAVGKPAAGIALYTFQSQEYEQLTEYGVHPLWLADSRRLLFRNRGKILLVDRRSGDVSEVYSPDPDEMSEYFSVSRDNRWIYVTVKTTDSELWLLDQVSGGHGGR